MVGSWSESTFEVRLLFVELSHSVARAAHSRGHSQTERVGLEGGRSVVVLSILVDILFVAADNEPCFVRAILFAREHPFHVERS